MTNHGSYVLSWKTNKPWRASYTFACTRWERINSSSVRLLNSWFALISGKVILWERTVLPKCSAVMLWCTKAKHWHCGSYFSRDSRDRESCLGSGLSRLLTVVSADYCLYSMLDMSAFRLWPCVLYDRYVTAILIQKQHRQYTRKGAWPRSSKAFYLQRWNWSTGHSLPPLNTDECV